MPTGGLGRLGYWGMEGVYWERKKACEEKVMMEVASVELGIWRGCSLGSDGKNTREIKAV